MIIWGSRGVTSALATGQFHCPRCNQARAYEHKKVRRFFTLYFIPLFPMATLGEYVECGTCKGTYKPEILQYDPNAAEAAFREAYNYALSRALVSTMLADGAAKDSELQTFATLYQNQSQGGAAVGRQEIQAMIDKSNRDTRTVADHFTALANAVNTAGKERLLEAAVRMAVADGPVGPEELAVVTTMARSLGISEAHLKGIVAQYSTPPA